MRNLPEYENNPLIASLPDVKSPNATRKMLARPPSWMPEDREMVPHMRRHCVQRLKSYFYAGGRSVMFADDFGMLLRSGYVARDPSNRRHETRALKVAQQAEEGLLLSSAASFDFANNADSSLLAGMSGMGKTLTIREVLYSYPQVIEHPDMPAQITYLRLDTPVNGSIRGLCVEFFTKVDALLGQATYTRLYTGNSATPESMMSNMALVANYHSLGCLVIDEIQHLPGGNEPLAPMSRASRQDPEILRFMVTLTNKMGVPVLFVGTLNAENLFNRTSCMARRSVGNFGGAWTNFNADSSEWTAFLADMWQYQWTKSEVPLTPELAAVMYDETQGVIDFAVKLFSRVQIRLILRSNGNESFPEEIDAGFIRAVADSDFKPIQGLLHALRERDPALIAQYQDLSSFQRQFDQATDRMIGTTGSATISLRQRRNEEADVAQAPVGIAEQAVREDLRRRGRQADVIDRALSEAFAEVGTDPSVGNLMAAVEKAFKRKPTGRSTDPIPEENLVEGDMRQMARDAVANGRMVLEAFEEAGIGGAPSLKLVA